MADLFSAFCSFLNKCCHLEGVIPVAVSFRKFNGHRSVLSGFPEAGITGRNSHIGDFHIFGIRTGKGKFIFQVVSRKLRNIDGLIYGTGRTADNGIGVSSVLIPGHNCSQIQFQLVTAFFTLILVIIALIIVSIIRIGRLCFVRSGFLGFRFLRFTFFRFRFLRRLRLLGRFCLFRRLSLFRRLRFQWFGGFHTILIGNHNVIQFFHIITNF